MVWNPYTDRRKVGVKFLRKSDAEAALEHVLTFGLEMIDYLKSQKLLRKLRGSVMKPNFERIDFLIDQDLQTLAQEYGERFDTDKVDPKLVWAASRAYRKGLARGMQMAMAVDTLVQAAVDEDEDEPRIAGA